MWIKAEQPKSEYTNRVILTFEIVKSCEPMITMSETEASTQMPKQCRVRCQGCGSYFDVSLPVGQCPACGMEHHLDRDYAKEMGS